MEVADSVIDIQISKSGPSGRPLAVIAAPEGIPLDKLTSVLQREITRNTDLRTKLGLKGCTACASSGFDIDFRRKFDHVMRVDLARVGS